MNSLRNCESEDFAWERVIGNFRGEPPCGSRHPIHLIANAVNAHPLKGVVALSKQLHDLGFIQCHDAIQATHQNHAKAADFAC